jgi:hypothetical protein
MMIKPFDARVPLQDAPIDFGMTEVSDCPFAEGERQPEWIGSNDGIDLARAFAETGDLRHFRTWERLMSARIRQLAVGDEPGHVTARRVQNWIFAWSEFRDAPASAAGAGDISALLIRSLTEQLAHLRTHLSGDETGRTVELQALFMAALTLPVLDSDGGILRFAVHELWKTTRGRQLLDDVMVCVPRLRVLIDGAPA